MSKPLVWAADCHLAPQAWAKRPELRGDAYYSFAQVCAYAGAHAGMLILAGDVLDTAQPDPVTAQTLLVGLQTANCDVRYITGQHDQHQRGLWLNLHHRAQCIDQVAFTYADLNFYGLNWHSRATVKDKLAAIPENTDVLIAHQVWGEFCPNAECTGPDVPHVSQIWTGDFHQHVTRGSQNAQGEPLWFYSPGSLAMQSVDEPPAKFFYVYQAGQPLRSVPLRTRKVYQHTLLTLDDLQAILAETFEGDATLPEHLQRPILWVQYAEELPNAKQALEDRFAQDTHLFLKVRKANSAATELILRATQQEAQNLALLQILPELVAESDPVYSILVQLLEAEGQPGAPRTVLEYLWNQTTDGTESEAVCG